MQKKITIETVSNGFLVELGGEKAIAFGRETIGGSIGGLIADMLPELKRMPGDTMEVYIDTDKGIDHHINEPALIDIVGEDYGMEGVRVQALGEDFIISLHDAEGGKDNFTYDEAMKWLEEHGQQTFTRKQAGIICIYIDEINDKLVEAGGEAFAADWYTTNELYIPREQRSSADYNAYSSWFFGGSNGCFGPGRRCGEYFRCRPSLALAKPY